MRFETIKTEIASCLGNAPPSKVGSAKQCPATVWNPISQELLTLASAFMTDDAFCADIRHLRAALQRASACLTGNYHRSKMMRELTDTLNRHINKLALVELEQSFPVVGDSPVGSCNKRF